MPLFFLRFRRIVPEPQRQNWRPRSRFWFAALCAVILSASNAWGQAEVRPGSDPGLAGQVVDGRTGAPLDKVLVVVESTGQSVLTGEDGRFLFPGLKPGTYRLYVSV